MYMQEISIADMHDTCIYSTHKIMLQLDTLAARHVLQQDKKLFIPARDVLCRGIDT